MARVLLVCPEPLGQGQPAGIGIRVVEIARVLAEDGHAITILSPDGGSVAEHATDVLTPQALLHHSTTADVAIVEGHAINDFVAHAKRIPTVVDLYDPFIIENLHYHATRGKEVFAHDHATLMRALAAGDFFLCASEAQRMFFLGTLLAAGRLNPVAFEHDATLRSLIDIAPFGVHAGRDRAASSGGHSVLFGSIYDWYDPITAIDAIAIARRTVPDIELTFTVHPNAELPQGVAAHAARHAERFGYGGFIHFVPWVPYEQRGEFFDRFALSLITFPSSIETDLAMRTRIYDYLWAGLPVITSPAPGTDSLIEQHGAGTVVHSNLAADFAAALVAAFSGTTLEMMTAGTHRFVEEHQWAKTLAPLREFCRAPRIDETRSTFVTTHALPEQPRSLLLRLRRRLRRLA
jgi:glycosyltransferase involved in cell wall biosynthesis